MSADPPGDEVEGETLADLLGAVEEGDRLTLTLLSPDDIEETRVVESISGAEKTAPDRGDPASGNVAVWFRDLERVEGDTDGVPYATVRYRPVVAESPPTVRVHGHTPTPEATAGIEYLGDVVRAVVNERSREEAQNTQ